MNTAFDADWDAAMPRGLARNHQRGSVAERRLAQILSQRGYALFRQMPVVSLDQRGLPVAGRIDLVPVARPDGRPAPAAYEVKSVDLRRPRYRDGATGLNTVALSALVRSHARQVLGYQRGLAGLNQMRTQVGQGATLPGRVRLVYQVPAATPPAVAAAFQQLALRVARPMGVAVTVIMPGSRAARVRPRSPNH